MFTQTADQSETTCEAIRNTIVNLQYRATMQAILIHLASYERPETVRHIASCVHTLEDTGEISRTPTGNYVLGQHTSRPDELTLTSTDQAFGQPALF